MLSGIARRSLEPRRCLWGWQVARLPRPLLQAPQLNRRYSSGVQAIRHASPELPTAGLGPSSAGATAAAAAAAVAAALPPLPGAAPSPPPPAGPRMREFFGCYLLESRHPRGKGRTYVGFTVNPRRRLRQHNGEIANGACKTKG